MCSAAVIIDTETTNNDPRDCDVVEIGWKTWDMGVSGEAKSLRFSHQKPMAWGALATHHILPVDLFGLPQYSHMYLPEECLEAQYWIGHNVDFDWQALGSPMPVKRICTLAMARALFPELDSHTLSSCMYFLLGATETTRDMLRSAHSAGADIGFCEAILSVAMAKSGASNLEDLYLFSEQCRVPKVFAFGKFKGQPIANADRGYANWYRKQENPDPYYLEAFRRAGLI